MLDRAALKEKRVLGLSIQVEPKQELEERVTPTGKSLLVVKFLAFTKLPAILRKI